MTTMAKQRGAKISVLPNGGEDVSWVRGRTAYDRLVCYLGGTMHTWHTTEELIAIANVGRGAYKSIHALVAKNKAEYGPRIPGSDLALLRGRELVIGSQVRKATMVPGPIGIVRWRGENGNGMALVVVEWPGGESVTYNAADMWEVWPELEQGRCWYTSLIAAQRELRTHRTSSGIRIEVRWLGGHGYTLARGEDYLNLGPSLLIEAYIYFDGAWYPTC
jgi:hypothetical protein